MPDSRPTERIIELLYAVIPQIVVLREDWADRLNNRKSPVSRNLLDAVNRVLAQSHIVLSREKSAAFAQPVPNEGKVTPGDFVVAPLQAETALVQVSSSAFQAGTRPSPR